MKLNVALALLLSSLALLGVSHAAIIITPPTSSTDGSFTITNDISFTVTSATGVQGFFVLLDDLAPTSDGSQTFAIITSSISYSVNGLPLSASGTGNFVDNLSFALGTATANDSYFFVDGNTIMQNGDIVTISAGTYTIQAIADFNPLVSGTFSGNATIVDNEGNFLSAATAIPEPSSCLLALGSLGFLYVRKRK